MAELIDVIRLAVQVIKEGGDPKIWCRLIGHWIPKHLTGVVAVENETEPKGLIVGRLRGKHFHIYHMSVEPGLEESSLIHELWGRLVKGLTDSCRTIIWVVDERDLGLHKMMSRGLRMKAVGLARDWYAPGHHGIRFHFPLGEMERGGKV